jgi:hypothetical protein
MTTEIQLEKLDDIQLAVYLTVKNNPGQPMNGYVLIEAERILKWMRDKRQEDEKEKQNN